MPLAAGAPMRGDQSLERCARQLEALRAPPPAAFGLQAPYYHGAMSRFSFKEMVREVPDVVNRRDVAKLGLMGDTRGVGAVPPAGQGAPTQPSRAYNQGRWQKEEHQRFLEGLERYGRNETNKYGVKNAKQIAELIGTRSVVQVRTHAQKYFQKMEKMDRTSGNCFVGVAKKNVRRQVTAACTMRTGIATTGENLEEATKMTQERLNEMGQILASVATVNRDGKPSGDRVAVAAAPCSVNPEQSNGHNLRADAGPTVQASATHESMRLADEVPTVVKRESTSLPGKLSPIREDPEMEMAAERISPAPVQTPPTATTAPSVSVGSIGGIGAIGSIASCIAPAGNLLKQNMHASGAPSSWTAQAVAMVENHSPFASAAKATHSMFKNYTDGKISQQLFTALHLQHVAEAARKYQESQAECLHELNIRAAVQNANSRAAVAERESKSNSTSNSRRAAKGSRAKTKSRRKPKGVSMEMAEEALPTPGAAPKGRQGRPDAVPASTIRKTAVKQGKTRPGAPAATPSNGVQPRSSVTSTGSRESMFEWDVIDFGEPFPLGQGDWDAIGQPSTSSASCSSLCPSPITYSGRSGAEPATPWQDKDEFGWFGDEEEMNAAYTSAKMEGEFYDDSWLENSACVNNSNMDTTPMTNEDIMNVQHVAREITWSAEARALQRMQLQNQM